MLDVGDRYLRGGRTDYLREGSVRGSPRLPACEVHHSKTDMLVYQVDVALEGLWECGRPRGVPPLAGC